MEEKYTTQLNAARKKIITPAMKHVAGVEGMAEEFILSELAKGRLVIPANKNHLSLKPVGIGQNVRCKINANIGSSSVDTDLEKELEKLRVSIRYGSECVMDLSTGGDLDLIRKTLLAESHAPLGTVPLYEVANRFENIADTEADDFFAVIEKQAEQGVDFMTIHAGLLKAFIPSACQRVMGIVSRGGALIAKWMDERDEENPFFTHFDRLLAVCKKYDVTLSLGDGLRPGCLADANDEAQFSELETLGELTLRCWEEDVQVMIEGPGHIPFHLIQMNVEKQKELCHGAPFYVLGPVVTDIAPGYDHITSAIGATMAGFSGAALLCYVTPREHLGLPTIDDVREGVVAYKIAAHAVNVARGFPGAQTRDNEMSAARHAFDWEKQFSLALDPDKARRLFKEGMKERPESEKANYCSMCGPEHCSIKRSREVEQHNK